MCVYTQHQKKAIWDTVIQTVQCEFRKLDHGVRKQAFAEFEAVGNTA